MGKIEEQGNISIHTENIFPIIKKWLYSEKEIFVRELVANAVDAIHKLKQADLLEGLKLEDEFAVEVSVDSDAGTVTIKDNGIGMTADEVRKYINQIAFSSAEDFIEKFKGLEDKNEIIGHFGLGFYSSFMVAKKVEIKTLSYQKDAKAVLWSCDGSTSYELTEIDKETRGTEVILYLEDDEKGFAEKGYIEELLKRYCNFLPVAIKLDDKVVNELQPLWAKPANQVTDEEYKAFYQKLYPMASEPLFWIHLNIDHPFNLRGILYFPKLTTEFDASKSHIKLFCNQVFVTDNCPELIPEFLTPLEGCLDAPDLPLNVSRSYLQNDPQVRKIKEVITGRVARKLKELAKADRKEFEKIWQDIHSFVKYGMMRDDKFYEKLKDDLFFRTTHGDQLTTLEEYLERCKEKHENKVYYSNDEAAQAIYLKLFKGQGLEVLLLDALIDSHFIQFIEMKFPDIHFERVDADVSENLLEKETSELENEDKEDSGETDPVKDIFSENLSVDSLEYRIEGLKDSRLPAMVLLSEQTRRFQEMTRMMGDGVQKDMFNEHTLLINSNSPVIDKLKALHSAGETESVKLLVEQIYDLAMLSQRSFDGDKMEQFIDRSNRILEMMS